MMYVFMHMYAFEWVCKCMCMHMCEFISVHKNASGVQNTNFKKRLWSLEYCQLQHFIVPENASQQEGKEEKVKMKALGREGEAQSRFFVKVSCAKVNSLLHKRQENSLLRTKAGGPGSRGGGRERSSVSSQPFRVIKQTLKTHRVAWDRLWADSGPEPEKLSQEIGWPL